MSAEDETVVRRGVVAVILRKDAFLVIKRSRHVVAPGKLCFPGGGIIGDEREEDALLRELREELNVDVIPVRCIWRSRTPWGVGLAWWRALLPGHVVPVPDEREVESFQWLTTAEMDAHPDLLESNRSFLAALRQGRIRLDGNAP